MLNSSMSIIVVVTLAACNSGAVKGMASEGDAGESASSVRNESAGDGGGGRRRDRNPTPPSELGREIAGSSGTQLPTLWLQPADLMTSTGDTPIQILLDNGGRPVATGVLSTLAASAELRSYPDMKLVPVDIVPHNTSELILPDDHPTKGTTPPNLVPPSPLEHAFIELRPKSRLPESWYVLSLSKVPSEVRAVPWAAAKPLAGVYAVRFHTGSHPVVKRLLVCDKGAGATKVVYELSENVQASAGVNDGASLFSARQEKARCGAVTAGPATSSTRWLQVSCENVDPAEPWKVRLGAGLVSRSGVPLTTFSGASTLEHTFLSSSLPQSSDGCRSLEVD